MINTAFKNTCRCVYHFFSLKMKLKIEQLTVKNIPTAARKMYTAVSGVALVTVLETGMPSVGIPSVIDGGDQRKRG